MNGFSVEWLGLREPLDVRSRSAKLAATLAEAVRRTESRDLPIQVVDLGAGTGANLRYLAPLLGGSQDWLLADRDPSLLDALDDRMRIWADSSGARVVEGDGQLIVRAAQFKCRIRCVAVDLATELDRVVLPERCLVTASGLLDLVSEDWLARLAHRSMNARASVWFTLSYDGRINCNPAEPEDRNVRELFNRHQLGTRVSVRHSVPVPRGGRPRSLRTAATAPAVRRAIGVSNVPIRGCSGLCSTIGLTPLPKSTPIGRRSSESGVSDAWPTSRAADPS